MDLDFNWSYNCFVNLFYLFYQEMIQLETARLYKLSGVDPLAG